MTIYTQTPTGGPGRLSEHTAPLGEVLGADVLQSWLYAPTSSILRSGELRIAERGAPNTIGAGIGAALGAPYLAAGAPGLPAFLRNEPDSPIVDAETARSRMTEAEVEFDIPDAGIRSRALDILIERHKREAQIQSTQARAPGGVGVGALRLGAALGTQMADPLNVASAFIPVVGPVRYAAALGRAGGAVGRAGVRASFGAVEGAAGALAVEPIIYGAATQEQADYGLVDSLLNVGLGTVLGGGLHVGAGVAIDAAKAGKSWRTAKPDPTTPIPYKVEGLSHQQREQMLRTSVSQALTGREINPLVTYERSDWSIGEEFRGGAAPVHEPTVKVDEITGVEGITLYHGSPHTFDRFSMEKVGTGEGAQSYGHGLYFAESRGVAGSYKEKLSAAENMDSLRVDGKSLDDAFSAEIVAGIRSALEADEDLLKMGGGRGDLLELVKDRIADEDIEGYPPEFIKAVNEDRVSSAEGSLYEVRLNAKPDDFLDWDKLLSEQSEKVQNAVRNALEEGAGIRELPDGYTGENAIGDLNRIGKDEAARLLNERGLSGIRYLDAGSRDSGDGSSNYVVFDDSLVTTVRRNEENLLRRPEDLRTAVNASFVPEASRLYDVDGVRVADEKIKAAPKDDVFPEQSLDEAMEDVTALVAALEATAVAAKRGKPLKPGRVADPEKHMPRFPVQDILKKSGGVRPDSPLGVELMAMGLTKTNTRGLFTARGRGAADNLVSSEHSIFAGKTDEGFDYVPEDVVLEALRSEIFGTPWRSPAQMEDIDRYQQVLGRLDDTVREEGPMPGEGAPPVQSEEEYGMFADMVSREMAPFEELQMTAEAYGRAVQEAASCGLRRGTA